MTDANILELLIFFADNPAPKKQVTMNFVLFLVAKPTSVQYLLHTQKHLLISPYYYTTSVVLLLVLGLLVLLVLLLY